MAQTMSDRPVEDTADAGYPAQGILQGNTATVLRGLRAEDVGACLWERPLRRDLLAWIAALPKARLPALRAEALTLPDVLPTLRCAFAEARTPEGPLRQALEADILSLVTLFDATLRHAGQQSARLNLRLDVIEGDACRRFHIDRLRARMLCTYRGDATQFALAQGNGTLPDTPVAQLATGDVGVMRGTLWPAKQPAAVLHRSPPIAGSGQTRLLLVIDPWEGQSTQLH